MPTAKALDKKRLWRDIEREDRRKKREKLAELRVQIWRARAERKAAMKNAVERCRTERLAARERARALRIRGLAELREAARLERMSARDACTTSKGEAKGRGAVEQRRAELAAEAKYLADLRRIERGNRSRQRAHPHASYVERRAESDDEVRANVPSDLVVLFERVKRGIKGSQRMSRTEAFLKYAQEHPKEVLSIVEDKTDSLIRELEQAQSDVMRSARRSRQRDHSVAVQVASQIPF